MCCSLAALQLPHKKSASTPWHGCSPGVHAACVMLPASQSGTQGTYNARARARSMASCGTQEPRSNTTAPCSTCGKNQPSTYSMVSDTDDERESLLHLVIINVTHVQCRLPMLVHVSVCRLGVSSGCRQLQSVLKCGTSCCQVLLKCRSCHGSAPTQCMQNHACLRCVACHQLMVLSALN